MPVCGSLDVRLMRTLHILLEECSVSRTADILGQSQPTVSLTLKRLRAIANDPLLVRSGNHLVLTRRGNELRKRVGGILKDIEESFGERPEFDPSLTERRFQIIADNCLGMLMVPPILSRLRSLAAHATFDICATSAIMDLGHALAEGGVDLAIGNTPYPPETLRTVQLFQTEIACVVNARHPLARRRQIGMEEYLTLSHLSPSPREAAPYSPIDGKLRVLGLSRHVAVSVPEYALVPHVLAQTDLVFTTGRPFAEQLAQMMPFSVLEAPPELGTMTFHLLWHERVGQDPANLWLRRTIRGFSSEIKSVMLALHGTTPSLGMPDLVATS